MNYGLTFTRRLQREESSPSQCHSMIVSGSPKSHVPTAVYSMVSPASQVNGSGRVKRSRLSVLGSAACTPVTTTLRLDSFRTMNWLPLPDHFASLHGTLSSGLAAAYRRFASSSCATCDRSAATVSFAAFRRASKRCLSVSLAFFASRSALRFLHPLRTHPMTAIATVTTNPTNVNVVDSVQVQESIMDNTLVGREA